MPGTYDLLCENARETALLTSIEALLSWDERTIMPPAAGEYRAEQMTYLTGLIHDRQTDPALGDWLGELAAGPLAKDPHSDTGATIRELKRQYDKRTRLPKRLVEELTRASVLGQQVWQQARRDDDYASFRPSLDTILTLKREQAQAIGYRDVPYDALLDDFEPGESTKNVTRVLAELRKDLVELVAEIAATGRRPAGEVLEREFPVDAQESFGRIAAAAVGFDFQRGRLDVSPHPFCSEEGPHDCRITTRYHANLFTTSFFGILHEVGHGLYDQGLLPEAYGLPLGSFISLGIHESQSRMWENFVGRSKSFWKFFYPQAQAAFPQSLAGVSLDEFYFAVNQVRPSLIRVEADEATYNLHILIRFELEQDLLDGRLSTADLPKAWNGKYQEYLGVDVPNDADGVLQDIHWSAGLFGYFPTYSLGNVYAGQFFAQAERDLGDLNAAFGRGEFRPLLDWLRSKIHTQGQRYTASELVERITGGKLSHAPLVGYLRKKLAPLYGL